MSALSIFDFQDQPVRVIERDEQPWFVAADVCRVLEVANPRDAVVMLDADEKGVADTDTLGGNQKVNIISESGLYALIFKSRKPNAKAFRKWVTAVVLPAIRQTGIFDSRPTEQEDEEVCQIALMALRGLRDGTIPLNKAVAMFTGVKVYQGLRQLRENIPFALPSRPAAAATVSEDDQRDFSGLIIHLRECGEELEKRWRPAELRSFAAVRGLFKSWLTTRNRDEQPVTIRFGRLCEALSDSSFDGFSLHPAGRDNAGRFWQLKQVKGVSA